jgi:hypothetical protein
VEFQSLFASEKPSFSLYKAKGLGYTRTIMAEYSALFQSDFIALPSVPYAAAPPSVAARQAPRLPLRSQADTRRRQRR